MACSACLQLRCSISLGKGVKWSKCNRRLSSTSSFTLLACDSFPRIRLQGGSSGANGGGDESEDLSGSGLQFLSMFVLPKKRIAGSATH
jgi:hypothetical protein